LEFKYSLGIILRQTFYDIFSIVTDFLGAQSWFLIELSTLQRTDHSLVYNLVALGASLPL
jgi:hypothetical protein